MAIRVYFMLFTLCVLFGASFQQRQNLRKRLGHVESMVGNINMRTRVDITELRAAVEQLQNKSDENSLCDADLSSIDAAAITHLESRMEQQGMQIIVISKAVSDEKEHTRAHMNEIEQTNRRLTQQVNELTTDVLQTKQNNQELTQQVKSLTSDVSLSKQINDNLTEELTEVKSHQSEADQINTKLNKQVKDVKEDILEMRKMLMKTQQKNTEPGPSSTTTTTTTPTQETTTEPEPSTSTVTVPVAEPTCPVGWSLFQNTCYLHVRTNVNWDEAKRRCTDISAILAEPDTREKLQYLEHISRSYPTWLGGTDRQSEGTWIWSDSGRRIVSDLWYPGQPDSLYGGDDCLGMDSGGCHDVLCKSRVWYICEKHANMTFGGV